MKYNNHKDIPSNFRRLILDETGLKRVSKVSLYDCNQIINDHLIAEQEDETLKNFEIEFVEDGKHGLHKSDSIEGALIWIDRLLSYDKQEGTNVSFVMRQAGRTVRAYHHGQYLDIPSRDKIRITKRVA